MLVWYLEKSHDWHNLRNWTGNDVLVSCKELILPPWSMTIVATSVTNVVLNHNSAFTIDHAKCLKLQILISGKLMTDLPPLYYVIFSIYICILIVSASHLNPAVLQISPLCLHLVWWDQLSLISTAESLTSMWHGHPLLHNRGQTSSATQPLTILGVYNYIEMLWLWPNWILDPSMYCLSFLQTGFKSNLHNYSCWRWAFLNMALNLHNITSIHTGWLTFTFYA